MRVEVQPARENREIWPKAHDRKMIFMNATQLMVHWINSLMYWILYNSSPNPNPDSDFSPNPNPNPNLQYWVQYFKLSIQYTNLSFQYEPVRCPGSHRISSGPLAPVKSAGFQKWPKKIFSETSHFTPKFAYFRPQASTLFPESYPEISFRSRRVYSA